jgi:serine kinase of HPr protein (carbohydrate metabolism regulator)
MSTLVHGTALVVGTTGLILLGPAGAGKSSMALKLIASARRAGQFATVMSDDQLFLDVVNGRIVVTAPPTIRGLIELRGSGIGQIDTIESSVLHLALSLVDVDASSRIPEENQHWTPIDGVKIPLYFIDRTVTEPFAWLSALLPGFPVRP